MTRLLTHPDIDWRADGTPVARGVDDVYFAAGEGLDETRAVFLRGCSLPEAWQGQHRFTVGETGFGTGLNFVAVWQMWRAHRPSPEARLDFVSFERFPLRRDDAARALSAWPELAGLVSSLLQIWPQPVRGVRQWVFSDGVSLTLHLGDIGETLPKSEFSADAWFLDGFSPARNLEMWSPSVYREIAARSRLGARAATFTVAGHVRRGLEESGFEVFRAPGHGKKRQRLEAVYRGPGANRQGPASPRVAVIGAGIAGATAAHALKQDGAQVSVYERNGTIGGGASGNPLALLMPRLDAGDTVQARLLIDAYLSATHTYRGLPGATDTEVRQMPKGEAEAVRFAKLLADRPLPLEDLEAIPGGGLLHKRALILRPSELLPELLEGVDLRLSTPATLNLAERRVNGEVFDALVLADAMSAAALLPWLGLEARLGQVDYVQGAAPAPAFAIAQGSYALNAGKTRLWGATFEKLSGDVVASARARDENHIALQSLSPWWIREAREGEVQSRAGVRATTADRLPLIGALPDYAESISAHENVRHGGEAGLHANMPGIFLVNGFGARGFTWGPLAGGMMASAIAGRPSPVTREAAAAVSPLRVILRGLKRGLV